MKRANYILILLPTLMFAFASCKKCADCTCTNTYEYGTGVSAEEQAEFETTWESTHPELNEEICGKKKDLEEDKTSFETKDDENPAYSVEVGTFAIESRYKCACVDQD